MNIMLMTSSCILTLFYVLLVEKSDTKLHSDGKDTHAQKLQSLSSSNYHALNYNDVLRDLITIVILLRETIDSAYCSSR